MSETKIYPAEFDAERMHEMIGLPVDKRERASYFMEFDADDWDTLIGIVHVLVAPNVDSEVINRQMTIGSDEVEQIYLMQPKDRRSFLENTVEALKSLDGNVYPNEYLRRISRVMALLVVLAHPYEDGNGRTARTLSYLIDADYNENDYFDNLQKLGTNRPISGFRINSYKPKDNTASPEAIVEKLVAHKTPLGDTEAYTKILKDTIIGPFEGYN